MTTIYFYLLLLFSFIYGIHLNHNQPFGSGNSVSVEQCNGFKNPVEFLKKYFLHNKPLLFKHAAKNWPAFKLWSDDYFLGLDLSSYKTTKVNVEVQKKENRSLKTLSLEFKEFIRLYNKSEIYLVDKLPNFLDSYVGVPWSLQCSLWKNSINQVLMWFSSGGTSSVVHTDDMENINCLISGEKTFVLVDPHVHKDKIPFHKMGAYSDIDVDKVDFTKYPGMATVDFQIANMTAGDCLYIPRLWIHQVRSFHRNIAINIWFTKTKSEIDAINLQNLEEHCSQIAINETFMGTNFKGFGYPSTLLVDLMKQFGDLNPERLLLTIVEAYSELNLNLFYNAKAHIDSVIKDIFIELDRNKNFLIEMEEINNSNNESLNRVGNYLKYLKVYLEGLMTSVNIDKSISDIVGSVNSNIHSEL